VYTVIVHSKVLYLIVGMNAAHMSIQAAKFSEYTTALFTEERFSTSCLCVHSLQQPRNRTNFFKIFNRFIYV